MAFAPPLGAAEDHRDPVVEESRHLHELATRAATAWSAGPGPGAEEMTRSEVAPLGGHGSHHETEETG